MPTQEGVALVEGRQRQLCLCAIGNIASKEVVRENVWHRDPFPVQAGAWSRKTDAKHTRSAIMPHPEDARRAARQQIASHVQQGCTPAAPTHPHGATCVPYRTSHYIILT